MFDPATVRAAFEEATGVRLEPVEGSGGLVLAPNDVLYESPKHFGERFGGDLWVRVYIGGDWRDRGVEDDGLKWVPDDFGEYWTHGEASRANVSIHFFRQGTAQITPAAALTWPLLTSCLGRLSSNSVDAADSTEANDSRTGTSLWVVALGIGLAISRWRKARVR